jgi:hypothetical protein
MNKLYSIFAFTFLLNFLACLHWSFANENSDYYDYLRKEAAERICDRIDDISRSFPLALEIGSHRGHIYNIINIQFFRKKILNKYE